ncbi:hypothetical protein RHSIM_Rhsim11G0161500 [Rhododendron simsii]|uniref:Glycosyltransferase n=1 Tax=Rhododendron simsii TaxID=118357 RepID=A0A834GB16_RHOSS|nr:hypothetical protein RHSIM_Rhsim11G0161500 [Rhododendron simsii]
MKVNNGVRREEVGKAVRQVVAGEEVEEMRNKVRGFKEMAKKAVEKGGLSYVDLNALIQRTQLSYKNKATGDWLARELDYPRRLVKGNGQSVYGVNASPKLLETTQAMEDINKRHGLVEHEASDNIPLSSFTSQFSFLLKGYMDSRSHNKLHIYFLPMMAQGHMLPMVDMARLFARHGVKATLILTTVNATLVSKTIDRDRELGLETTIRLINFPSAEVGLPEGIENHSSITSPEMSEKMYKATELLQQPFENLLEEDSPDCLVADLFFPWASEVATKRGIPRLIFHGIGAYALCVYHELSQHKPYKNVESDSEVFVVPGLPNKITMTRRQLPDHIRDGTETHLTKLIEKAMEAEVTSYGVVINSFHELEPAYSEHYSKTIGRKVWHVGPVSLCNRDNEDKTHRGSTISINEHESLTWLDSKEPNSVLYVCFGSLSYFSNVQLLEIAMGLENSGHEFIWVVRKEKKKEEEDREEWLPDGFEKRLEGKGFIIRGWAPQVLILDHKAVGGFMTHCGWNSLLEGVTAGVPLIAWPLFAEQFYNEKLVTDILRVGIGVGAQEWCRWPEEGKIYVKREDIEKAVVQLLVGEEAEGIRSRARALGEMAKKAVEKGGSSYNYLSALLEELELNTN